MIYYFKEKIKYFSFKIYSNNRVLSLVIHVEYEGGDIAEKNTLPAFFFSALIANLLFIFTTFYQQINKLVEKSQKN